MPTLAKFNKTQYRRDWLRVHHTSEQQLYPIYKSALDQQVKSVSDFVKHHGVANLSQSLSVLIQPQPMQQAYQKAYQKAGVAGAEFTLNHINKVANNQKSAGKFETKDDTPPIGFNSEHWRKLMSLFYHTQAAQRIKDVDDTTKQLIQELLDENQDLPLSQQASIITDVLDDPDYNRMRALRIARTETTAASNYGAFIGGESSDYEVGKSWLAILDAVTRIEHADADGQQVEINDSFDVGGVAMMYPGDLSAPPKLTVNCRCSLVILPMLDQNGLPILKKR